MAIITVMNEYGSSGYEIAARAAELLQFDFIDRQVISVLSKVSGIPEDIVEYGDELIGGPHKEFTQRLTEKYPTLYDLSQMIDIANYYQDNASRQDFYRKMEGVRIALDDNPLLRSVLQSTTKPKTLQKKDCLPEVYTHCLEEALLEMARQDNCIFIGRYARGILRNLPNTYHVRTIAPVHVRVKRVVNIMNMNKSEAELLIAEIDAKRKKFFKETYNLDITDCSIYDLIINTDSITIESAARMLTELV